MTAGASVRHRRRFVEMWGGEAATWFSGMREARPARRAGPIVRLPQSRPSWPDEGSPRRALNQPDRLLHAKRGGCAPARTFNPRE